MHKGKELWLPAALLHGGAAKRNFSENNNPAFCKTHEKRRIAYTTVPGLFHRKSNNKIALAIRRASWAFIENKGRRFSV